MKRLEKLGRLTNTADGIDYAVAAASGIVTGIIDILWDGEFSIERANQWGNKQVEKFVVKVAQMRGYGGDDLAGAVKYLEDSFPIAADRATNAFGGLRAPTPRLFTPPYTNWLNFAILVRFAVAGSTDWMMGVRKVRLELPMAWAETAKTAQTAIAVIRSVEHQKTQTQENLDRLTEEVNKTAQLKF